MKKNHNFTTMENNVKHFEIFQKMVDNNSSGIVLSTTVVNATTSRPQGGTVEFGVEKQFASDVQLQAMGLPSRYMVFALFVDREEFAKYKKSAKPSEV